MSVGSVLARTFSLYGRNVVAFSLISLIVHLPLLAYTWMTFDPDLPPARIANRLAVWALVFLFGVMLLGSVAAGPVTYGVVTRLRGARAGIGECLSRGFRRLPRILGVTGQLLVFLFVVALITVLLANALLLGMPPLLQVIVLATPMTAVLAVYWVALPVAVTEEPGASGALRRSSVLTSGNFWKIFAILVLFAALQQGADFVIGAVAPRSRSLSDFRTLFCVKVLLAAVLFGPLRAVATAVGYHDLRTSAEGIGTEEIARVFE